MLRNAGELFTVEYINIDETKGATEMVWKQKRTEGIADRERERKEKRKGDIKRKHTILSAP